MWGWPVSVYLFLGGLSAGAFAVCALLQLAHGSRFETTYRLGALVSVALLAVGASLLLFSVGAPTRALDILQSFRAVGSSWMARGVWIIIACAVVFTAFWLVATLTLPRNRIARAMRFRGSALNIVGAAGMLLAAALACYTGLLLSDAQGIRAWRTPLVPALFLASSADSGLALVSAMLYCLEAPSRPRAVVLKRLGAAASALSAGEAVLLVLYACWHVRAAIPFAGWAQAGVSLPAAFFATTVVALLLASALPIILRRATGKIRRALILLIAAIALLAGYCLRCFVLSVGVHAALPLF